jgi:hypothetical protein
MKLLMNADRLRRAGPWPLEFVCRTQERRAGVPARHYQNLIDTIRGDAQLAAGIEVGHLSASLCHLANISTRVGRSLRFDPAAERILGDDEAAARLTRDDRNHWTRPQ